MTYIPRPGDVFVRRMGGDAGRLIRLGQFLCGDGFRDFEHAGIVTEVEKFRPGRPDLRVVEAQPGGAVEAWHRGVHLADDGRYGWAFLDAESLGQLVNRRLVVDRARRYVGTGYSAADYLALAAHRFRLPVPGLREYVATSRHMICSQLADQAYQDAGVHLFADGRWPGYVTPGDLSGLIFGKETAS